MPDENPRTRPIAAASIVVDTLNPRVDEQQNHRDALRGLVRQVGDKILNLAADIVREGLDPSSLPIVIKSEADPAVFVALEGNRRVAALKMLARPDLVLDLYSAADGKRLRALAQEFAKKPITEVNCVVFDEREQAHHWIELRHSGEQEGRGLVRWGGKETARFEERRGRTSRSRPALQALDLVRKKGGLSPAERDRLHDVPITTVQRLLNDPAVRERIGVDIEGGKLTSRLQDDTQALKGLTRIFRDAALGQLPVSRVDTKVLRKQYIDDFAKDELPAPSAQPAKKPRPLGGDPTAPVFVKASGSGSHQRSQPPSRARHTIIPWDCKLSIKANKKLNDIYWELKRIEIDTRQGFPMAAAVLFRVFLEVSLDSFILKHNLLGKKEWDQQSLKQKMLLVSKHLETTGRMTKQELSGPRRATDDNYFVAASITTLHGYVHHPHFTPGPSDLKAGWDSLQPFFEAICQ